jgi:hypothetical protein
MPRLLAAALLLAAACVPRATIPDADRARATQDLTGQLRWLRTAAFVGPFYGDRDKALLSDQPLGELDLLENPEGQVIAPPPAERVLPPGTPLRIRSVEFPTGMLIASRVVLSPRYHPWVILEAPDESRPLVLVLSQTLASYDQALAEVDRMLAADDPSPALRALPAAQRDAVLRKGLVEGMGPSAISMAWGRPQKKIVDRPAGTEEWVWAEGRRRAFLQDDRLVRWEAR